MGKMTTGSKHEECQIGTCEEGRDYELRVEPEWSRNFNVEVCEGHEFELTEKSYINRVAEL